MLDAAVVGVPVIVPPPPPPSTPLVGQVHHAPPPSSHTLALNASPIKSSAHPTLPLDGSNVVHLHVDLSV